MWAGLLNLTVEDLPGHATTGGAPWYPIELVCAIAMLWLFSGLRTDKILRLRLGAIRWQHQHSADSDENGRVCLLEVRTNKTSTAFTKGFSRTVGLRSMRRSGDW